MNAAAIDANALEATSLALWNEWLASYFDGQPHDVGTVEAVDFPLATLAFQQASLPQPLGETTGLAITLVTSEVTAARWRGWRSAPPVEGVPGRTHHVAHQPAAWNFWVRAAGPNAKAQGGLAADRLHGLINNSAANRALAQKGIQRLIAQPPRAVMDSDYTLRLVSVRGMLRYAIKM